MKSVDEVAQELAIAHKDVDGQLQEVFQAEDPNGSEVRLIEVSGSVGHTGSVMPFRFSARPDLGIPYPSVVVLLSPEEKSQLEAGELALPASWGPFANLKRIA